MSDLIKKPIVILIVALVLLLIGAWLVNAVTGGKVARVLAELRGNQTEAALESGADAVGTVGAQGAAEDAVDAITEENEDAIRHAEGADAPVAPAADAAGRASLCKRAAYRGRPECVQHAPAR